VPRSGRRRPLTLLAARRVAADAARVVLVVPFWRRHAHEVVDQAVRDRRRRRKLHAYVDALADACHGWRWTGTTVLTHAAAAEALGCCLRTVSYLRADLDRLGLLTTAEEGSTPATRRAAPEEGNRAPVYVLTRLVEAVSGDDADEVVDHLETRCGTNTIETSCSPLLGSPRRRRRTAAVEAEDHLDRVRAAAGVSARWLDREVTTAGLGGLTPAEVGHVLRHAPDGSRWTFGPRARRAAGAVRWMLRAWSAVVPPDGNVDALRAHMPADLDDATAEARWRALVDQADRLRAAQAARRAADEAERASAVPMPEAVRDLLADLRRRREVAS
jgi:hypothetical protein